MSRVTIVLLIIAVILVGVLIALYFIGKRLQARQEQSDEQIQAMKQPMTLLVIDKKRLKLKESGLPDQVIQQTPWYAKRSKVPVVKAKVGPQFINFISWRSRASAAASTPILLPGKRAGSKSFRRRPVPSL